MNGPAVTCPGCESPYSLHRRDCPNDTRSAVEPLATTVDGWVDRIRPHLAGAVEHIVSAGVELIGAKNQLGHGQFGDLCERLGLTRRTAQRFMVIARHPTMRNATTWSHLPANWTVLHELAQAPADDLAEAIEAGEVTPRTSGSQARQIVARLQRAEPQGSSVTLTTPAPLDRLDAFPVLYVDPPWRYEHAEPTRAIENNYPTMALADIKTLPVPACDDAVLFLWVTPPKITEAVEVIDAWGFTYRTCLVWVKDKIGMGYYARQRHEMLFVARRGDMPVPPPSVRPDSVIEAPRLAHSAKPEVVYELIERMYPDVPKLELFARRARPGWATWGNQAPEAVAL